MGILIENAKTQWLEKQAKLLSLGICFVIKVLLVFLPFPAREAQKRLAVYKKPPQYLQRHETRKWINRFLELEVWSHQLRTSQKLSECIRKSINTTTENLLNASTCTIASQNMLAMLSRSSTAQVNIISFQALFCRFYGLEFFWQRPKLTVITEQCNDKSWKTVGNLWAIMFYQANRALPF